MIETEERLRRVAFVAHDSAPTRSFKLVTKELLKRGFKVQARYGREEDCATVEETVCGADYVVVGIASSHSLAREELMAVDLAKQQGSKVIFFADIYKRYNSEWINEGLKGSTLTVIDETEAEEARLLLPYTKVMVVGNPEWDLHFVPKSTKDKVYAGLQIHGNIILYTGGKNMVVNIHQLNAVIDALMLVDPMKLRGEEYTLLFSVRPEESIESIRSYLEIAKYSPIPMRIVPSVQHDVSRLENDPNAKYLTRPFSASELLPAVKLVIQLASGIGVEAAHLRIPVIDFFSATGMVRYSEGTGKDFSYPPAQRGATVLVKYDVKLLGETIYDLLFNEKRICRLVEQQKMVYPNRRDGQTSLERMLALFE